MGFNISKVIFRTGLIVLSSSFFISSIIFAQNYTGFGNGGSALPPRSNLNNVMSKDDFKNSVTNLGNQNQQMVKQQVQQSLPKSTIVRPSRPAGTGSGSQLPTQQPTPPSYSTYSNQQPTQPTQGAAPTQPAAPASGGVYTGFGAGTAPTTPSKPSSGSDTSGWNINY